jgi:hypothetical protein
MTITSDQSQVCLDAVTNCEHVLRQLRNNKIFSPHIENLLNECARICMGTYYAITNRSVNASQMAVLCIGICEECADVCAKIDDKLFQQCAEACRYCSHNMYDLAIESLD